MVGSLVFLTGKGAYVVGLMVPTSKCKVHWGLSARVQLVSVRSIGA